MGDNYPYSSYIKTPQQLGASPKGSMSALKKDLAALGDYIDVLTTGSSKAHTVNGPLGNQYFLSTDTECKDKQGVAHPRYVYINNIPSDLGGVSGRGLVPGILQDMMYINPSKLFSAFSQNNLCREVTMKVRNSSNVVSTEKQYVLDDDLVTYPASWFPEGKHPINKPDPVASSKGKGKGKGKNKKKKGKEKFTNYESDEEYEEDDYSFSIPEVVYYTSVSILFLYLAVKFAYKLKLKHVARMKFV